MPLAVHAGQPIVVLALEAELADHGAGLVLGELRQVQFVLADLTGVANDVSEHAVPRIEAGLRRYDDQLGEEIVVRIDKGEVRRSHLFLEGDGLVAGARAEAPDAGFEVVVIQVEALGYGPQMLFFQ